MDGIRVLLVHDICKVDNMTQGSSWRELLDFIRSEIGTEEEILLDFKGVNVIEPWTITEFGEVLKFENVYFRFTSSNKESLVSFVNKIKMKCIIDGLKSDRIESVYIEPKRIKTKAEIELEKDGEFFISKFEINDENKSGFINMENIYSQIGSVSTVDALIYAIKNLKANKGINKFVIKTGKMFIQANIIELLAKRVMELDKVDGISLDIDTDVDDTAQKLGLYIHNAINESYTLMDKIKEFVDLPRNLAIMLVKYKKSRAVDEFGRNGKGQVVSSRIALYRGLCIKDGYGYTKYIKEVLDIDNSGIKAEVVYLASGNMQKTEVAWFSFNTVAVIVDSFNTNKFMTHAEWLTKNDGEIIDDNGVEIKRLPFDRANIFIDDIGLLDKFLGKRYHILNPIQKSADENMTIITDINDLGFCVKQTVTIPERIKIVLDDWNEQYNEEELNLAIEKTKNLI